MTTVSTARPADADALCSAWHCPTGDEGCPCSPCDAPAVSLVTVSHSRYSKSQKADVVEQYLEWECQAHAGYWQDFHGVSA